MTDTLYGSPSYQLLKPVILVGIMGVGKTSIGRILAKNINVKFCDTDQEIEKAANASVSDIFEIYGEQTFIDAERKVLNRLLKEQPQIISTGVGTFTHQENRATVKNHGISIWLKASYDTIYPRVSQRNTRPQLDYEDKEQSLKMYFYCNTPHYAHADIQIDCDNLSAYKSAQLILDHLKDLKQLTTTA